LNSQYKVGDYILLRGKIEEINTDNKYHYNVAIYYDNDEDSCIYDDISDNAIVSIFNGETAIIPLDDNKLCECFKRGIAWEKDRCHGTKEMDACECKGDQSKCDFYESIRNKTNERVCKSKTEDAVTADMYQTVLKDIQKLAFYEIMAIFGWSDYEAPLNKESCIARIIEDHNPKGVIEAYEQWKFKNTVNVGDVIYLEADKKEYLVTNIIRQNGIVQYHMIAKDFCVSLVGYSNVIEQMPSNAFTKIKSNETIQNYLYRQEE
jgi:hypothetical protein